MKRSLHEAVVPSPPRPHPGACFARFPNVEFDVPGSKSVGRQFEPGAESAPSPLAQLAERQTVKPPFAPFLHPSTLTPSRGGVLSRDGASAACRCARRCLPKTSAGVGSPTSRVFLSLSVSSSLGTNEVGSLRSPTSRVFLWGERVAPRPPPSSPQDLLSSSGVVARPFLIPPPSQTHHPTNTSHTTPSPPQTSKHRRFAP